MNKITVKPAKIGVEVIHPQRGRLISRSGEKVILDKYFSRRIKDGDLVIVEDAPKQPKRKKAHQPKAKIETSPEPTEIDE
tara:strand:- start:264 stop:503 length:240 start_codon:yes stop_codon:yes gene_type:complete